MKLPLLRRSPRRTTMLGVAALAVLLWAGVTQLGVDINELLAQLLLVLGGLLVVMVLAGITALPIMFVRRRRGGSTRFSDRAGAQRTSKEEPGSQDS